MQRYTICALIGACFIFTVLTALALVNLTRPPDYEDPFAPFDRFAPGQPTAALAWGVCDTKYYVDDMVEGGFFCNIQPKDGPFRSITVAADGDRIAVVWFSASGLRVGDLVYRWGRPNTVQYLRHQATLRWTDGVYAVVRTRGWYTLQSPIDFVLVRQPRGERLAAM